MKRHVSLLVYDVIYVGFIFVNVKQKPVLLNFHQDDLETDSRRPSNMLVAAAAAYFDQDKFACAEAELNGEWKKG